MPKKSIKHSSILKNLQEARYQNSNFQENKEDSFVHEMERLKVKNCTGRRLLALRSITEFVEGTNQHQRECKIYNLKLEKEICRGLQSSIIYKCACNWSLSIESDVSCNNLPDNDGLLWGCQNSVTGYDSLIDLTTALELPTMAQATFFKYQTVCKNNMLKSVDIEMQEAGAQEKVLAEAAGDFIFVDGIRYPCTRVIVDGGWSKRSYGHSYSSNCGVAVIIGSRTGKVLHMGTRIKTCYFCKLNEKSDAIPQHTCSKNWTASSTAMESNIIRQGFEASIVTHGLVYSSFVGDGDSSVFSNVQNVYKGIKVEKVECLNHVVRNFKTKMFDISKNTVKGQEAQKIPLNERKVFNKEFGRIVMAIRMSVSHYQPIKTPESWKLLREDILNIPYHVFGSHQNCKDYFCKTSATSKSTTNLVAICKKMKFWLPLSQALQRVANLAKSLIEKETSNKAESFMATANKFIEGKRKNWGQGYLYKLKMASAVFSFNNGRFWITKAYRNIFDRKVSQIWDKKTQLSLKERGRKRITKPRADNQISHGDADYGKTDFTEEELKLAIEDLRKTLQVTVNERDAIFVKTMGQSNNTEWFNERKHRITASIAGTIFKLKPSTDNTAILNQIFGRSHVESAKVAMQWGSGHEDTALKEYERVNNLNFESVNKRGLFVSLENGCPRASPDGLIGEDGMVEVKCPFSLRDLEPKDWPSLARNTCPIVDKNGVLQMKTNHIYYYQSIMQLYVADRKWVDFFIWTPKGHFQQRIERNSETDETWKSLKCSLESFWNEDLAPELVDSRYGRQIFEYRCPEARLAAREKKKEEKRLKDSVAVSAAFNSAKRRKI